VGLELAANAFMAVSVLLAGRNSIHTWWTGILGCLLFAQVFYDARLYADVTLQFFFLATSGIGWWRWRRHEPAPVSDLARGERGKLLVAAALGVLAAIGYGGFLVAFTNAEAPYADSLVLMSSVIAQVLLMRRRVEAWWFWIVVNTIAVPLFASRGLWITSVLYAAYLVNAVVALRHWRRLAAAGAA
jgi:nicotinamide mononucleotide transporter